MSIEAIRELETLASVCPELNMANYTEDDVRHLNDWAIEMSLLVERYALSQQPDNTSCKSVQKRLEAQQPATGEPVGYMNEGHIHELAMRRLPYGYVYPEAGAGASTAVYTRPAPSAPKDDQIAALVNKVRDIARMFHDHQSLRERIAIELVPALKASQEVKSNAERWRYAIADGGNQSMNFIDIFGDWDGDGDFVEVFDAARLADKESK